MPNSAAMDAVGAGRVADSSASASTSADFHPTPEFFDHLPPSFGAGRLEICVAGLSARLDGLSSRQHSELSARYGIFARPGRIAADARPGLAVDLRKSPRVGFLKVGGGSEPILDKNSPAKSEMYRLLTRVRGNDLIAWSYEWAARCDFATGQATLVAASDERVVFDRIVENFLRVAFAHMALPQGGFLLHGAGVVRNDRAFIFFGPSGSGKTTATTLSAGATVLSDDLLLITRNDGGGYAVSSVPFRGVLTPPATTDALYPIAGLFRLAKSEEHGLEKLNRPQAVGQILQSLPFVTDAPESAPRLLDIASDVAANVPVFRLHFRKDAGFWGLLENV